MPGRGHRIASRQAQLGQRRRRQGRAVPTLPSSPPPVRPEEAEPQPAPQRAPVAALAHDRPRGRPEYRPGVLNFIGPELKRIAVLGSLLVVVLVVLGAVL